LNIIDLRERRLVSELRNPNKTGFCPRSAQVPGPDVLVDEGR
jgi:hypothetical protein